MPEPPTVGFRRTKNLKDHLDRAKLRREEEAVVGMFKCGKNRCKICDNVAVGDKFKSNAGGGGVLSALIIVWIVAQRV